MGIIMARTELFDHPYFYRLLTIFIYLGFLRVAILAFNPGKIPILPNLFLLIIALSLMFLLTVISQLVLSEEYSRRWIVIRMILSIIPTLLGSVILVKFLVREFKKKENLIPVIGMALILMVLIYLTSIIFALFVLLAVADPIPGHTIYLVSITIFWSMLAVSLADHYMQKDIKIYGKSKRKRSKVKVAFKEKIGPVHGILKWMGFDKSRRRSIVSIISIISIFLLLTVNPNLFNPVAVNYQIDPIHRNGDAQVAVFIENIGDDYFDLNADYNGSLPPVIINTIIINKTASLATLNYGVFSYTSTIVPANSSIENLHSNSDAILFNGLISNWTVSEIQFGITSLSTYVYQELRDPFKGVGVIRSVVILDSDNYPIVWFLSYDWEFITPNLIF